MDYTEREIIVVPITEASKTNVSGGIVRKIETTTRLSKNVLFDLAKAKKFIVKIPTFRKFLTTGRGIFITSLMVCMICFFLFLAIMGKGELPVPLLVFFIMISIPLWFLFCYIGSKNSWRWFESEEIYKRYRRSKPIILKFQEDYGKPRIYKMGKSNYRQITYNEIADNLDNLFDKEVVIDITKEDYDNFLKWIST